MLEIKYNNKTILFSNNILNIENLQNAVISKLNHEDFYFLHNGKVLNQDIALSSNTVNVVHVVPRLVGGKGGFGSMLRAIGAQIEKTTNREACRDLSGRRLRDINEEKRLKAWIDKQANREKEAEDRKQKKLQRLVHTPKHEFKDEAYDKERSDLPERLEDAVTQGLIEAAAASSSTSNPHKRKSDNKADGIKKKKKKTLWIEDGLEVSSSDDTDDSASEKEKDSESPEEKIKATN